MTRELDANIAVFCDFENIAIGAREAKLPDFDMGPVLERLLDKGNVVVKKAYADWDRYKGYKKPLHEHAFELIEVPHVSYSGKNSADIRLVVDVMDLCHTKGHIDTFVIMSGDSDFSPLVSKLKENNKTVIGIGVKQSSSNLLIENCDEYVYYNDLMQRRHSSGRRAEPIEKQAKKPEPKPAGVKPAVAGSSAVTSTKDGAATTAPTGPAPVAAVEKPRTSKPVTAKNEEGVNIVMEVIESLFAERDDILWASMVRRALKRRRPNFTESEYGYRYFHEILRDAAERGYITLNRDPKTGGLQILGMGPNWLSDAENGA